MNNLISIVVPTYNRAELLKETLNSIISQTYRYIEIIVVDDGSVDNTSQVVSEFGDNRVKYLKMSRLADIAKLRNIGITNSLGDFICFCDDDDIWHSNKLDIQFQYSKSYNFVCSNANVIDINSRILREKYFNNFDGDRIFNVVDLLEWNKIITSSVLIRKQILNTKFNEKKSTISAEDYEMWLKLSENNKILYIDKPLISFRVHNNTSTFNVSKELYLQDAVSTIIKKYHNYSDRNVAYLSKMIYLVHLLRVLRLSIKRFNMKFICKYLYKLTFIIYNPKVFYSFILNRIQKLILHTL